MARPCLTRHRESERLMKVSLWLAAVSAFCAPASAAEAQKAAPGSLGAGVYGGVSFPLGDFKDSAKPGYHVGAMIDRHAINALSIRLDIAFNKFSDKTLSGGATFREVGTNLLFGTLGAELSSAGGPVAPARGNRTYPYLLAGVGAYRVRFDFVCRGPACEGPERVGKSDTNWGLNIGAGSTVPIIGVTAFLQVGYHLILPTSDENENTAIALASLGLKFR
jgi:opacity protein-like surface antigen